MIEELTLEYISQKRVLILAVISCKDEIENQAIFHLARQVDPIGHRTMGVLTKPDTIEAGTHEHWIQVLMGNQYALKSGYFMVKCPSALEMKHIQNHQQALILELEFFKSDPWATLQLKTDRLGVPHLSREISRLLANLIESSLPELKSMTEKYLDETRRILDTIPPPIGGEGKIELLQTIRHFCTLVNYHIHSQQNLKSFHQKIRKHFEAFYEAIQCTRPELVQQKAKPASTSLASTLLGFSKAEDPKKVKESGLQYTLADLKQLVSQQRGRELDGMYSYGAVEALVTKCQDEWKTYSSQLLHHVSQELKNLLNGLGEDVFSRFENLHGQIRCVELM